MDRLVFETLRDWLLKQLNTEKVLCHQTGDLPRGLKVSRNIAALLNTLGRPFDAEKELHDAMRLLKAPHVGSVSDEKSWMRTLPSEFRSEDVYLLMSDYGLTCLKQGRHDEATAIYEDLFKSTGDHLFLMNLAMCHRASLRFDDAERLYTQCLEMRKQLLGAEHHKTMVCMNSLAVTYRELKKFELAEPLFLQVIDIGKRTIGEHHTDTEAAVLGLANCYRDQRRFSEAERLCVLLLPQALPTRYLCNILKRYTAVLKNAQRTKGFSHPETLDVLANIANVNGDMGFYEEDINRYHAAEKMYREAIEKGIETVGPQHPLVVRWQKNFAIDMQAKKMLFG
jgi:tetratricopeptide (TPR) repeat protein